MNRKLLRAKLLHTCAVILISLSTLTTATTQVYAVDSAQKAKSNLGNKKLRMLRGQKGPMAIKDNSQRPLHEKVADQFAPQFGLPNPTQQLRVKKQKSQNAKKNIRYGQLHQGLPVIGGELVANLNEQDQLTSMSGEISAVRLNDVTPTISAEQASANAMQATAKWYQLAADQLVASTPVLSIFDPSLLMNTRPSSALVWEVNVSPNTVADINEKFFIDANTGGIVLHFNEVDTALLRETHDANNLFTLPGALICNEATPSDTCSGDADTDAAHAYARDTYEFYFNTHARDGINDAGMKITSTVHFGTAADQLNPFQNAFWLGSTPYLGARNQMVYGDGFALADDVVAHELTHGVTNFSSNLIYLSESGAINESMSDLWGEFVDQTNGAGSDAPADAWKLGEDLPAAIGVVRDMKNPGTYSHPDRMTSPNFYIGNDDNGGVHINSGVNNKAAYLMVDGDTFNGQTVVGMGITKTAKLYYQVQTNYLTTGADYLDLYNALNSACADLVTSGDLVTADCTDTVAPALAAVEMNQTPNAAYAPSADICAVGSPYDLFLDDFENNGLSSWAVTNQLGSNKWTTGGTNLASNSGDVTILTDGHNTVITSPDNPLDDSDTALELVTAVRVPASETAYIHFDHAFYFEEFSTAKFDGGVIEYSIDNGSNWVDASSLIDAGRNYNGVLAYTNPESGRSAFTTFSNGYNSTRLNLSSLAGNYILFRFRSLADESVESGPWTIDNFRFYLCANNAPPIPNAGVDQTVSGGVNVQLDGSVTDPDGDAITYQWTQQSGPTVTLTNANTLTPSFTSPSNTDNMVFALSATSNGVTETDTVTVSVNFVFAGSSGGGGGCSVSQDGRFDPLWLLLLLLLAGVHIRSRRHR